MTELEEVVITGKSLKQEEIEERTRLYSNPSNRLILDSLAFVSAANSIFDLLLQVPGVAISGFFPNQSASIRGFPGAPIYLIDGMPVDVEFIQSLPVQDVEFIDVLKGPEAAVFGSRGGGGAILVYTRRGQPNYQEERPTGLLSFTHPGYHKAKEFYSPQYDVERSILSQILEALYIGIQI